MANNDQQWPTMANNGYNVIAPLCVRKAFGLNTFQ